jgi:hypothetical protein
LSVADFCERHFGTLAILVSLLVCVPLVHVSGKHIVEIVKAILHEFGEVGRAKPTPGALNAIGGVMCGLLAFLLLEHGSIALLGGQISGRDVQASGETATAAIVALLIPFLLGYFLVSISITKSG